MRLAVLFLIFLAGCAPAVQDQIVADQTAIHAKLMGDVQAALSNLQKVAIADLKAAAADAALHSDPEAAMCWNGLLPIAQSLGAGGSVPSVPNIIGGATLFQAVRDVLQGGVGGSSGTPVILKQINMACGPLYVSARNDVMKVAIMVGAAAAGGPGAASAAGALPSAVGPLLNLLPIK